MKIVVGLGNPGRRYAQTRHNAGFMVLDKLASELDATFRSRLFARAEVARAHLDAVGSLLLVKPLTFMNSSGTAVAPLMRRNGLGASDLVVVTDDVDLPLGRLRVRPSGGSGGHNGLKSLIGALGSEAFARVRLGVGRETGPAADTARHVLTPVSGDDRLALERAAGRAAEAVCMLLREGAAAAMNQFNAIRE